MRETYSVEGGSDGERDVRDLSIAYDRARRQTALRVAEAAGGIVSGDRWLAMTFQEAASTKAHSILEVGADPSPRHLVGGAACCALAVSHPLDPTTPPA